MISTLFAPHSDACLLRLSTKQDGRGSQDELASLLDTEHIVALRQVHGDAVHVAHEPSNRSAEADIAITNRPGLVLTARGADCQIGAVYAPSKGVIATFHAGWKGLLAGTIPSLFKSLRSDYGVEGSDVIVYLGPSLCTDCAEFSDPAHTMPHAFPQYYHHHRINLRAIAEEQLLEAGVSEASIERHPDCTCCHPQKYWTYRGGHREEVANGASNVLAIVITKEYQSVRATELQGK